MLNDKEELTLKDKDGNQINITVDVPLEPQPQMVLESFSQKELYRKNYQSNDNDE